MKKLFTLFLMLAISAGTFFAYGVKIGDLYFELNNQNRTAKVIENEYYNVLVTITIPSSISVSGNTYSVTSIGDYAFYGCTGLTSITIPDNVKSIGECAFYECRGLTSIAIPNGITNIEYGTFWKCSGLTSVTIPNSVTSIGQFAFEGDSSLVSVVIPNSVNTIGHGAFLNCIELTSITIPNSVTDIGSLAFSQCSSLQSIAVESENITYDSRENCNAIIETATNTLILGCKNTAIPNNVTSIGESAFTVCTGLTSITIPNSVTSIGESAFSVCTGLTSITIPNSVTSIGAHAFGACTGLTSIICEAVTPPALGNSAFWFVNETIPLYVPANSITLYQSAEQWKDFNVQAISEDALPEILTDENTQDGKFMIDGVLYIRKQGHVYDIKGTIIE